MIVLVKSVRLYTWNYSKILLVFNFTKQLEVHAVKQEQVVSHMACMRAIFDSRYECLTFPMLGAMHGTSLKNFKHTLTCLTPCSRISRYTATSEPIHSVGASSTVQTWVTSALIDI